MVCAPSFTFEAEFINMKKRTARKLELFLHLLTSGILLLKGYGEIVEGKCFPGLIIACLAILVVIVLLLWKPLHITPKQARIACYYIESPAMFVTAYVLYLEGKEFHPYLFFIAGLLYPLVGFISSKKFKRLRKSS